MRGEAQNLSPELLEASGAELQGELSNFSRQAPPRLDCSAEDLEQGLARLVLSIIELLRRLLERQAIRRMEAGSLQEQQVEDMGRALMTLEQKIRELAEHFGLAPEDLNLDLGPLGKLSD